MYRENPEQADDRQYYDYHLDRNGSSLEAENEALRQPPVIGSVCPDCLMGRDEFEPEWKCPDCRGQTDL